MPFIPSLTITFGYIIASSLYFVLTFLTLFRSQKQSSHISYLILLVGLFAWTTTLYFYLYVDVGEFLLTLGRINYFTGLIVSFGLLAFFYFFPERKESFFVSPVAKIYIGFTLFLSFLTLFTPYIDKNEYLADHGTQVVLGELYFLYLFHMVGSFFLTIFVGFKKIKILNGIEKIKYEYAFFVFLPCSTLGHFMGTVMPLFGMLWQFEYMFITTIPIAISSFYAMYQYRFLDFPFFVLRLFRGIIFVGIFLILTLSAYSLFSLLFFHHFDEEYLEYSMIGGIIGAVMILFAKKILPEILPESFRKLKNTLMEFKSKIYSCQTYPELQKILERIFILRLGISNAKIFILRKEHSDVEIPIYVKNDFTRIMQKNKETLIADEIALQKGREGTKKYLSNLDAKVCFPLFAEEKLIGFFLLGKKSDDTPYSLEEIREIESTISHLEIVFMNILLKLNLQEENNMMKKIIREKTEDLQRQNEAIQKLFHSQSDFISVAAHELRTPLCVAMFRLQNVLHKYQDALLVKKNMKKVQESLDNLNALTNKMFDAQRYDMEKISLEKETFILHEFLEDIFDEIFPLIQEKNIHFDRKINISKEISFSADLAQLRQVFHNLLMNAKKFTLEKGKIILEAEQKKEGIYITISDTGPGISDEMKEKIFEKFSREKKQTKGLGLGLYICRKIMELHGGSISVKNNPGGGSIFSLFFPQNLLNPHRE